MAAPFIPSGTIAKIKNLGLGESRVLDVFYHGQYKRLPSGADAMVKKYNGYEVGLFYTRDSPDRRVHHYSRLVTRETVKVAVCSKIHDEDGSDRCRNL